MRLAIIGTGISGLTCAHYLQRAHDVTLFEAEARPGGHTNTVEVMGVQGPVPVDTGFIVFNEKTYPNFIKLLRELGIPWTRSNMSFSVRSAARDFEYAGAGLRTLYAQPKNFFDLSFHRMVLEIIRFYKEARELLAEGSEEKLDDYLSRKGYSRRFAEDHLLPMVRAVWSANEEGARKFPARFLVRFFENHGFLETGPRPQWLTLPGGSRIYVRALLSSFRGRVRLGSPVAKVRRVEGNIEVTVGGMAEKFDRVILACHSDEALKLVDDPTETERELLSSLPYQSNEAVLHTDASLMPKRRRLWSSWNVHLDESEGGRRPVALTYWMNRLQPLSTDKDHFVTLNATRLINPARVLKTISYRHPVFTPEGVAAQERRDEMLDQRGISYCGAYWRNGFHEDGVVSALDVVRYLGVFP